MDKRNWEKFGGIWKERLEGEDDWQEQGGVITTDVSLRMRKGDAGRVTPR